MQKSQIEVSNNLRKKNLLLFLEAFANITKMKRLLEYDRLRSNLALEGGLSKNLVFASLKDLKVGCVTSSQTKDQITLILYTYLLKGYVPALTLKFIIEYIAVTLNLTNCFRKDKHYFYYLFLELQSAGVNFESQNSDKLPKDLRLIVENFNHSFETALSQGKSANIK